MLIAKNYAKYYMVYLCFDWHAPCCRVQVRIKHACGRNARVGHPHARSSLHRMHIHAVQAPVLFTLQLWCGRRQRCRWWRAMPPVETTLSKLVMEYLVAEYGGSGDLEVFDALDFCDFREEIPRDRRPTQSQGAHPRASGVCATRSARVGRPPTTSLTWLPLMPPPIRGSC